MREQPATTDPLPLGADFSQHAQRIMADLREQTPVRRVVHNGVPAWLVTRHTDVKRVLTGPEFTADPHRALTVPSIDPELARGIRAADAHPFMGRYVLTSLLYLDPPDHTRLRRLVNRSFTPGAIARLRPRIDSMADDIIAALPAAGPIDLITDFAVHVPLTAVGELLGIPPADRRQFFDWALIINGAAGQLEWDGAMRATTAYFADLIGERRRRPQDDLLSHLIAARDDGDRLSEDELIAMAMLILFAGHDTTVTLITNSVLALLQAPGSFRALRADPALIENAVDELVRFHTPVNLTTPRYTLQPVTLGGVLIPAGEKILVSLLSANQDEGQFADAAHLDVRRNPNEHLGFGHGVHYCLGAPLARMETAIALQRLITRFPHMRLAAEPDALVYRATTLFHSLTALPVELS